MMWIVSCGYKPGVVVEASAMDYRTAKHIMLSKYPVRASLPILFPIRFQCIG